MAEFAVETVGIDELTPHARNYRGHPLAQLEHLRTSIREYGVVKNVVVSSDNVILAGHGIVAAARAEGLTSIPVHRIALKGDDPKAEKFLVLDNEVSRLAEDDSQQLAALLSDLQATVGLDGTGHDDASLSSLFAELAAEEPKPEVNDPGPGEPPQKAITQPGDVWVMGEHRLVCGDCREDHLVADLFAGSVARMVWTDPPYGVSYSDKNEFLNSLDRGNRIQTPIENDHMTEDATETLCREALVLAAAHSQPGGAVYVACPAGTLLPHFIAAVAASGYTFKHSLVWVKQHFVLGRCDYHYRHEVILYGWKPDAGHYFVDDHALSSVFEVDKPHKSDLHPTMKPVELIVPMIENSSKPGEVVYDPFSGSGSTLIACEQTGRVFRGCELEAWYCDVIVTRYQDATGKRAILEATGKPFPIAPSPKQP